ncbi:hypothetical protein VMCG_09563 [Cytospora schulzeri]|uniref:EKC/KEOPS complex subunit GON7 n=1 Tax=Cytospora schulzeri TaxID=448051 RepID=A0A423VM82_9PEZI|nr:hypothetical protein VMCG_09563 [Valsa malicola]
MSATNDKLSLTASYTSPSNAPFNVTHELQAPPSGTTNPTVPDKTMYLNDLRKAAATMQDQINKELTQRMEEDKVEEEATRNGKVPKGVDEAKEEDYYGEEVVEEED